MPQRPRVGRLSFEQANERIVGDGFYLATRGFTARKGFLRRNQELDIIHVGNFWQVHNPVSGFVQ